MSLDVVALGEVLIDFAARGSAENGYPLMQANPGGAPGNYLAALAKYGCRTAFIGKAGNDSFGKLLKNTMEQLGIDTRALLLSDEVFTTLAFVTFDETGDRSFSFARKPGADTALTFQECRTELIDQARVFHFGTLSLTDEPAGTATKKCVEYAKQAGKLISFDPNLRLPLWKTPEAAKEAMQWGLSQADVVKISDEEVDFLWQETAEQGASRILQEYGAKLVFVTLGAKGCYFAGRQGSGGVSSPKVHPFDTTGAGDIFGGSAMSRLLKLGKPVEELTLSELQEIVRFASAAASLSTEHPGGMESVPEEAKVMEVIAQGVRG